MRLELDELILLGLIVFMLLGVAVAIMCAGGS